MSRILTVNKRNPTIRIPAEFINSIEPDKRKTRIKLLVTIKSGVLIIERAK
jgi:hypothetical protein